MGKSLIIKLGIATIFAVTMLLAVYYVKGIADKAMANWNHVGAASE